MWDLDYSSARAIKGVLEENGLAMSKRLGQNFLLSPDARARIVSLVDAREGMRVWEVGPGLGAITHLLVKEKAEVTAFELDHGFSRILREKAFPDEGNFKLIEGDALSTLFSLPFDAERICGNLPYNVGSEIIARLIERGLLPERMVFTLQKEVAERMRAKPGEEGYSSFSVLTQLDYVNTIAMVIPRGSFYPEPRVDSAVVLMRRREESLAGGGERKAFLSNVRLLFAQRRKTVRNNLLSSGHFPKASVEEALSKSGLTGTERAEALSFDQLLRLSEALGE